MARPSFPKMAGLCGRGVVGWGIPMLQMKPSRFWVRRREPDSSPPDYAVIGVGGGKTLSVLRHSVPELCVPWLNRFVYGTLSRVPRWKVGEVGKLDGHDFWFRAVMNHLDVLDLDNAGKNFTTSAQSLIIF